VIVRDETDNFTTTGTIEFLAPPDFSLHTEFGTVGWWLRVRWDQGEYDTDPRVDRILLNTVMAAQTVTIQDEVLGSSDGSADQTFETTRTPVLEGQYLQVREPQMDAVRSTAAAPAADGGTWISWTEVLDFYGSDGQSRHYTVDHMSGQVAFGNGVYGAIPPVGAANIRMGLYKTGGGVRGNRPAGSIIQLKTTVPYIRGVINHAAASGGAAAESLDMLAERAPTEIRHRNRAVTPEDYEDIVRQDFSDVARALCVPNRDLEADPFDQAPPVLGDVSVMIVPNSADPNPQPDRELLRRVRQSLIQSCPATATVHAIGPLYMRIGVQVEIGLASLEGAGVVARKVEEALAAFLHPLTGGFDGSGWAFGREPHRSDIFTVIARIPEVDHIRALALDAVEDLPGIRETGRFLVYSGVHRVQLVLGR
jgi:predicted phage baseplate assembly protein